MSPIQGGHFGEITMSVCWSLRGNTIRMVLSGACLALATKTGKRTKEWDSYAERNKVKKIIQKILNRKRID